VTAEPIPLLVLGLGNVLCGDDGAGVEAIERISTRWRFPDDVRVLDGGTLGLSLLPYLRSAQRAILVDAVLVDEAPGTIVRFDGDDVLSIAGRRMSCHQIGVAEVLECARLLGDLPDVTLVGIAAERVAAMSPPTAAVSACIDALAERVVDEIRANGFEPVRLQTLGEETPHGAGPADSLRRSPDRVGFRDRL
jgi:hydrogenase maturation protease